MSISNTHIVIIDDNLRSDDPIIIELQEAFSVVVLFTAPQEGIEYINNHLNIDIIVILDIDFGGFPLNGHDVLNKIREKSFLIPVIIWSSINEQESTFSDFINNKAFAFVKRNDTKRLLEKVNEAETNFKFSVSGAIEDWISKHRLEEIDRPFLVSGDGTQYTLRDILAEVRLQTAVGKKFGKDLMKLTIDLLMRNKERLDD